MPALCLDLGQCNNRVGYDSPSSGATVRGRPCDERTERVKFTTLQRFDARKSSLVSTKSLGAWHSNKVRLETAKSYERSDEYPQLWSCISW